MFVAFCEAHGLLPAGTLGRCAHQISPCPRASNPRWRNFLDLFEALRSGHANLENGQGFQHALFSHDPAIDSLQLDDRWALMLAEFDAPDYRIEVPPRLIAALFRAASAAISSEFREFAPIFQPEGEVGK